jgi:hypothetical protein
LRNEFKQEIGALRNEFKQEIGALRTEFKQQFEQLLNKLGKGGVDETTLSSALPDIRTFEPTESLVRDGPFPNIEVPEGTEVGTAVGRQCPRPSFSSNRRDDGSGTNTSVSRTTKRSIEDYDDVKSQRPARRGKNNKKKKH